MNRLFKHQGFEEIRGVDACVISGKAVLAMPAFTSKGILEIEGACIKHRKDKQTWPDLICKLNGAMLGKITLGSEGAFRHSFDISSAKGMKELKLQMRFDYDQMWPVFSLVCRLHPAYRRRRRRMVQALGRDVHIHRITLDGRVLADFTHGPSTFLPGFSPAELGMGMNIVGFFQHEFGIGESARCCANAAKAAGIPIALNLTKVDTHVPAASSQWSAFYQADNPHPVNLFHIDPPQIKLVPKSLGAGFMVWRYNIGLLGMGVAGNTRITRFRTWTTWTRSGCPRSLCGNPWRKNHPSRCW